jgi:DinB superfamily
MKTVERELSKFQREYLWELKIPETQVLALAEAIPEEAYGWRPASDARRFSEALVHIGAGMLMLLYRAGVVTDEVMDLCGGIEGEEVARWLEMVHRSLTLEKTLTAKPDVIKLLKRGFETVEEAFTSLSDEDLEATRDLFGEVTTVRRVYLRILAHTHEHMGQVVAYSREMGFRVPWPDPVKEMERMAAAVVH